MLSSRGLGRDWGGGGLPFESEADGDACGQGLGAAFGNTTSA